MSSTSACLRCGHTNPEGTFYCIKCSTPFPGADDSQTLGGTAAQPGSDLPTLKGVTPALVTEESKPTVRVQASAASAATHRKLSQLATGVLTPPPGNDGRADA